MLLALVFGLIQLLQLMVMSPVAADDPLGRKSNLEEAADVPGGNARRAAMDLGDQSELVSRRRLYGGQPMPWNDNDIAWLKRSGQTADGSVTDVDKRGWGNGIPPWMRRRVVVVPASAVADRRSAKS